MILKSPGRPDIPVTTDTWWNVVEIVRSQETLISVLDCLKQMSLCPIGIVNQESLELIKMFAATEGIKNIRTPAEYLSLSAYWVQAVDIIEDERSIYARIKAAADG